MRVVLDTNILFSALISPHGAPDAIYRAWRAARFEVVTSRMQLDEIRRASRYPKLQAGSPPFSRTLTIRPIEAMRSVHVEAKEVQCGVQARCG